MELTDSTGRVVVDYEIEPSGVDSYFGRAFYLDDGSEVPDAELEYLTNSYPELLEEACFESAIMRAEDWADRDR